MKRDEGLIRTVFWKDGKPIASTCIMNLLVYCMVAVG